MKNAEHKAELGQIFTKRVIARYMVSLLSAPKDGPVLDPCFGGGAFVDAFKLAGYTNITGYEIDNEWFKQASLKYPNVNLICGDFLKAPQTIKYDAIVMNPPYIRQEKIDDLSEFGITKTALMTDPIYQGLPKTANLYMYFVAKAISLLSDNGELIVIFPSSWTSARVGNEFKQYLDKLCCITDQISVQGEAFEENALVEVFILRIKKHPLGNSLRKVTLKLVGNHISEGVCLENSAIDNFAFNTSFSEIATIRRGLTTGANDIFINPSIATENTDHLFPIISSPKSVTGYTTHGASTDSVLIVGENAIQSASLRQYLSACEAEIISNKKPKAIYDKIVRNENWSALRTFDCSGIVFGYFVRSEMKFVLNTEKHLVRDNFYVIHPLLDDYLVFALLNNYFTFYQLEKAGKKYGAGLLKLQRYDLEALVFPDLNKFSKDQKDALVSAAKTLLETSDSSVICEITKIIADATGNLYSLIENLYLSEKRHRLEQAK